MVRARIPAGRLTAAHELALDELADRYGNGTFRITTRQGIQFHGVVKGNLKGTIAAINDAMLTTLCACGDVVRNVMAPAATVLHRHRSRCWWPLRTRGRSEEHTLNPVTNAHLVCSFLLEKKQNHFTTYPLPL